MEGEGEKITKKKTVDGSTDKTRRNPLRRLPEKNATLPKSPEGTAKRESSKEEKKRGSVTFRFRVRENVESILRKAECETE